MANKKIKLTSPLSLKEVALESSQFDIPKKIQVDFSKARPSKKFKDGKQTDILSHYILEGIDERTAKAVNDGLIDQEDVKSIKIEVHGSFEEIEETIERQEQKHEIHGEAREAKRIKEGANHTKEQKGNNPKAQKA